MASSHALVLVLVAAVVAAQDFSGASASTTSTSCSIVLPAGQSGGSVIYTTIPCTASGNTTGAPGATNTTTTTTGVPVTTNTTTTGIPVTTNTNTTGIPVTTNTNTTTGVPGTSGGAPGVTTTYTIFPTASISTLTGSAVTAATHTVITSAGQTITAPVLPDHADGCWFCPLAAAGVVLPGLAAPGVYPAGPQPPGFVAPIPPITVAPDGDPTFEAKPTTTTPPSTNTNTTTTTTTTSRGGCWTYNPAPGNDGSDTGANVAARAQITGIGGRQAWIPPPEDDRAITTFGTCTLSSPLRFPGWPPGAAVTSAPGAEFWYAATSTGCAWTLTKYSNAADATASTNEPICSVLAAEHVYEKAIPSRFIQAQLNNRNLNCDGLMAWAQSNSNPLQALWNALPSRKQVGLAGTCQDLNNRKTDLFNPSLSTSEDPDNGDHGIDQIYGWAVAMDYVNLPNITNLFRVTHNRMYSVLAGGCGAPVPPANGGSWADEYTKFMSDYMNGQNTRITSRIDAVSSYVASQARVEATLASGISSFGPMYPASSLTFNVPALLTITSTAMQRRSQCTAPPTTTTTTTTTPPSAQTTTTTTTTTPPTNTPSCSFAPLGPGAEISCAQCVTGTAQPSCEPITQGVPVNCNCPDPCGSVVCTEPAMGPTTTAIP